MASFTRIERLQVATRHGEVPAVVLLPARVDAPLPVCLFLYGGGGQAEHLLAFEPLLAAAWREQTLPGLLIACLNVPPFCFYLDDPATGQYWERAVAHDLPDQLSRCFAREARVDRVGLLGISMGGYAALKIAFAAPQRFVAVAAIAPMLEPGTRAQDVPLRNRLHYPAQVPARLLGPERDPELFESDHPATRARHHADSIRQSGQAIYLDVGSHDALRCQDGAEYLHRVLWDLDLEHEYHLLGDANHIGPTLVPRSMRGFAWVARHAGATQSVGQSPEERELDTYLEPLRRAARARDASVDRLYGRLPAV